MTDAMERRSEQTALQIFLSGKGLVGDNLTIDNLIDSATCYLFDDENKESTKIFIESAEAFLKKNGDRVMAMNVEAGAIVLTPAGAMYLGSTPLLDLNREAQYVIKEFGEDMPYIIMSMKYILGYFMVLEKLNEKKEVVILTNGPALDNMIDCTARFSILLEKASKEAGY